mmetsp:Transcript_107378/g.256520  ORF Transcript_107378/g.256520 Transcript_107378/m.256520 type:complete len:223 (-) Transcript_107378:393-1061(-)
MTIVLIKVLIYPPQNLPHECAGCRHLLIAGFGLQHLLQKLFSPSIWNCLVIEDLVDGLIRVTFRVEVPVKLHLRDQVSSLMQCCDLVPTPASAAELQSDLLTDRRAVQALAKQTRHQRPSPHVHFRVDGRAVVFQMQAHLLPPLRGVIQWRALQNALCKPKDELVAPRLLVRWPISGAIKGLQSIVQVSSAHFDVLPLGHAFQQALRLLEESPALRLFPDHK